MTEEKAPASQTAETIQKQIVQHIASYAAIDPSQVDVDENIFVSGLVDSVGMMRLIADMEDQLGVTVPPPDLVPENFKTVRVMSSYLSGLVAASA